MSAAFAPRGTKLQRGAAPLPGSGFATIAEVIKIQRTGSKADLADVTNNDSPSAEREFLATLVDEGEIAIDCNFIPGDTTQGSLQADFSGQVLSAYQLVLPGALGTWGPALAYVVSNDFDLPIDKQGTRQIKLKITGAPSGVL